eukprot:TRINITY_DN100804_c0_g1_i1.p1 TRINITY_DN100804_c0_g1~~TRINITY_DN100804_c0_g1_i1.p1  ORF type:complete len:409 (-),score=99.83 TRINITY_DN100804_c0_g1_i1:173-1399(-)
MGGPCDVTFADVLPQTPCGIMCSGCGCILSTILIILFFPCTVTQLGQFKIGLARNTVTGVVDMDTTYMPGRYWIGFWREFIEFPSTLNTIEFSDEKPEAGVQHLTILRSRDKDGKQIFLDVSIQYKLKPDKLGQIYREMTTQYEDVYISELRDSLSKTGNKFAIEDAWKNYSMVVSMMRKSCEDVLSNRHADCWGLQLWGIRLDAKYEEKLIKTQVQKQAQRTALARLDNAKVRAETEAELAEYASRIKVIEQEATSQKYRLEKEATAAATARIIKAESQIVELIRNTVRINDTVSLTDPQIVLYQKWVLLKMQKDAAFVYNPFGGAIGSVEAVNAQRMMANAAVGGGSRRMAAVESDEEGLPAKTKLGHTFPRRLQLKRSARATDAEASGTVDRLADSEADFAANDL